MRSAWKLLLIAALAVAAPATAKAAACARVEPLIAFDILRDAGGRPQIPVTLNGRRKHLLVDTGSSVAVLGRAVIRELGLQLLRPGGTVPTAGAARSSEMVRVKEFRLGDFLLPDFPFWVDPDTDASRTLAEGDMAGSIGGSVLYDFNAEFDFGAGILTLFPQSHCPGAGRPLEQFTVVPFRLSFGFDVIFPVTLDGKRLEAVLDTGAIETMLHPSAAQREFSANGAAQRTDRRRFENLSAGGLTLEGPALMQVANARPRDGNVGDLTVGMSTLSRFHFYIAYVEHRLYIAPSLARAPQ